MAAKPDANEVTILDERIIETAPALGKRAFTAIVTYRHLGPVPRTVFIPLVDIAKDHEDDLRKQLSEGKGDLYKAYIMQRAKAIKADIEQVAKAKPEIIRL